MTRTSEGTDASEILLASERLASDFGETTITKTSEGTDATEILLASDFGEPTKTASAEGIDQVVVTELGRLDERPDAIAT